MENLPLTISPIELQVHAERIKRLWESKPIQETYEDRNKFQLVQSASYFLDKVTTVLHENYVPSDQDLLHTRVKTTGIIEHDFEIDMGKKEKRKLIMVKNILFTYPHMRKPIFNRSMLGAKEVKEKSGFIALKT